MHTQNFSYRYEYQTYNEAVGRCTSTFGTGYALSGNYKKAKDEIKANSSIPKEVTYFSIFDRKKI